MKKIHTTILFLFIGLFISSTSFSQIEEKEAAMSLGAQNSLMMEFQKVDKKKLSGYLKTYFKEYGKVKENRKADEFYITDAKIKIISKDKVDFYARIDELKNRSAFFVWIDNGAGFVNSVEYTQQYNATASIIEDFALFVEKSMIEEELKEAEKNLGKMERELGQLQKENDRFHKNIEDARERIALMESNIEKNVMDQESVSEEIEIHKAGIEEIKERLNKVEKNDKGTK